MTHVYLIRHAIAGERDARRWPDDRLRPLTPEGARKFRRAAAGLGTLVGEVDRLLTSPLVRTRQTADILHAVADFPAPIEKPELAPGRTSAQALALLREQGGASIVVVGHEPGLGQLLALCVGGADAKLAVQLKKGAAACLRFEAAPRAGGALLEWLLQPGALRKLSH